MVSFSSVLLAVTAIVGALAAPGAEPVSPSTLLSKRAGTPNSAGFHDGFYYSWWSDGGASATYTNQAGGKYSLTWGNGGNLVGGKGWNPGTSRYVVFFGVPEQT